MSIFVLLPRIQYFHFPFFELSFTILKPLCFQLTLSQTSPGFYVSAEQVFWKHWKKQKLLETSNFYFSHSVFYPSEELASIFIQFEIVVCLDVKCAVSERVKREITITRFSENQQQNQQIISRQTITDFLHKSLFTNQLEILSHAHRKCMTQVIPQTSE